MSANDSDIASRSMSFERTFDAPRELVWQAWTDPRHVGNWWGPDGFSTTSSEIDIRSGGSWRFIMHGPDGRDYPNRIDFIEVAEPERIVYAHVGDGGAVSFRTTINFESEGRQTRLRMQMVFETAAELRRVVEEYGAEKGAHQHLANLAAYLKTMQQEAP